MFYKKLPYFTSIILIVATLACNISGIADTPDATGTFVAVLTEVVGTAKAGIPTNQPAATNVPAATNLPPTSAVTSTPAPTFTSAPTATQSTAGCVDDAKFIADITIPDGTSFATPSAFTKTWRVQNIGTCTWNTTYSLKFVGGAQLGGPAAIAIPGDVVPGSEIDLSVGLTSSGTAGSYIGQWRLTNSTGNAFGTNGSPLTVSIVVPAPTTVPTATFTPAPGVTFVAPPLLVTIPPIIIIQLGSRASHYAGNWFNDNVNTNGITQLNISATSTNAISAQGWGRCSPTDCEWGVGTGTVSGTSITVSNFASAPGTNVLSIPSSGSLRAVRSGNTYTFHQGPVAADWVGTWTNLTATTNNITKIIIGTSGAQLTLHPYGKCSPSDCDWGTKNFAYSNPLSTGTSFTHKLTVRLLRANYLEINDLTVSKIEYFGR